MSFSDRLIGGESSDFGPEETQEGLKRRDLRALSEIPGHNRGGLRRDRLVKLEEKDRFMVRYIWRENRGLVEKTTMKKKIEKTKRHMQICRMKMERKVVGTVVRRLKRQRFMS